MTTGERAEKVADAVWTRLLARAAMIIFGVIGSVGIPATVVYLRESSAALRALDKSIDALRADWARDQVADAGRFARSEDRIIDHERRLQILEARRP